KAGKGGYEKDSVVSRGTPRPFFRLCRRADEAELVAQPLHCGTRHKDAAFQRIVHFALDPVGESAEKLMLRLKAAAARIQHYETACAIGALGHAGFKAALTHQGTLLITNHGQDGNFCP